MKARRPVWVITRGEEDMQISAKKTFIARLSPCRNAVRRACAELARLIQALWTSSPSPGCSQMALAGQGRAGKHGGLREVQVMGMQPGTMAAFVLLGHHLAEQKKKTFSPFCQRAQLIGDGFKLFFGLGLRSFNATNATLITSSFSDLIKLGANILQKAFEDDCKRAPGLKVYVEKSGQRS